MRSTSSVSTRPRRARSRAFAFALLLVALTAAPFAAYATYHGSVAGSGLRRPIVGIAASPTGNGYWLVASDGGVFSFGDARFFGSTGAMRLNSPIVGIAATPTGRGYWLVASDGGIFTFGDARFFGSTGAVRLNSPIVGIAATPTGRGYWLVASDGGIFTFGDARFRGSTGAVRLNSPIVDMASTPAGRGYWLVASDGGVFAFGSARFHGSTGGIRINRPVTGIAATRSGQGYWLVADDGGVFNFGDAAFWGSAAPFSGPASVVDVAAVRAAGYWIATQGGAVHSVSPKGVAPDPTMTVESAIALELLDRLNSERAARGLAPLAWDADLAAAANAWSRSMADAGRFAHQDLGSLFARPEIAARYETLSENIYEGGGGHADAGSAHLAFMGSDGHRDSLLSPDVRAVGIGVACRGGHLWITQDFGGALGPARPVPARNPVVRGDDGGRGCA